MASAFSSQQVAKILNSTSVSFLDGLDGEDQSALMDVLTDYFDDKVGEESEERKIKNVALKICVSKMYAVTAIFKTKPYYITSRIPCTIYS